VTWEELYNNLKKLGMAFTKEEIRLLTKHFDTNSDGLINKDEFNKKVNFKDYIKRS